MMQKLLAVLLVLSGLWRPVAAADDIIDIHYPQLSGADDPHQPYMADLLSLACRKMHKVCRLHPAQHMNQSRAIQQLGLGGGAIDLMWGMTSIAREQQMLPIRIPLYKGLIGWRVALVPAARVAQFATINTLEALRGFSAGQVLDWPDTQILRASGLQVMDTSDYRNLLPMLHQGRYDYFPRAVIEILQESKSPQAAGLVIEPHLLIHYPAAFYFFVSKQQPQLANMLTAGLEQAVADGSFEREFQRFNGDAIRQLRLSQRTVIELPSPLLPAATPLARRELWFQLAH